MRRGIQRTITHCNKLANFFYIYISQKNFLFKQKDRADIINLLVKHNANVNHLDRNSMAALHKAIIHDRPECCHELMESKADPNVIYMGSSLHISFVFFLNICL